MAASKLTRVRSEGFSKIMARVRFGSDTASRPAWKAALSAMARSQQAVQLRAGEVPDVDEVLDGHVRSFFRRENSNGREG